jgi:two-component system nitrate/nitrite response regulator NarL
MKPTRILIADDHPLYREGVARTLSADPGLEVVAAASDGEEAVALALDLRPDLVLLDLSMPGAGGLAALQALRRAAPDLRVAILTASEEDQDVIEALKAGAQGYVLKGIGGDALVAAVKDLARGQTYVSPHLAGRMLDILRAEREGRAAAPQRLTPREEEILRELAEGKSNKEIARALSIQEKTVKHHVTVILQKLQVRNRTEAALKAKERRRL